MTYQPQRLVLFNQQRPRQQVMPY